MSESDQEPNHAGGLWTPRIEHIHGPSIFDDRETGEFEVLCSLMGIVENHELSPEEQAFVGGLVRALCGKERFHQVIVKKANKDAKIRSGAQIERAYQALDMVDAIDIAVANGEKLEAEVAEWANRSKLSRREVFRQLSEVRAKRLILSKRMVDGSRDPTFLIYIPAGFDVDDDGKLTIIHSVPDGSDR